MIYYVDGMVLDSIREIFCGECNDVVICRDLNSPVKMCYTLLIIKDRGCAKKILKIFDDYKESKIDAEMPYLKCFTQNEFLCYVFEYRSERYLYTFLKGQMLNVIMREQTGINLVMEVLSCHYPYPILYLILHQNNIHIEKDNTIYLTPFLDLSELDESKDESFCVSRCASHVLEILQTESKKKLKSFILIQKKVAKNAYKSLPALYRDIKLTAVSEEKKKLSQRIKGWWFRNKDTLFRILLGLCIIVLIITIVMLLSQLIFGDVPLFRLFEHSFDVIGTETLK